MEEIKYTLNINSETPIMLINEEIGEDGIDGSDFQKELLYLDSLGKKSIEVWINSIGGSVMDGYSIASSILKSKTPVDTYNVGLAASIAGVIFMCGRNRVMMDYAQLMIHPVSGTADKKSKKSFESSLTKLLSAKSDITQEQVATLMKETSWLDAEECLEAGFATRIESTTDVNKQRVSLVASNVTDFLKVTNKILNELPPFHNNCRCTVGEDGKIETEAGACDYCLDMAAENDNKMDFPLNIKNKEIMLKVINKLGLTEDATEDIILNALELIENKTKDELDKLKEEMDALKEKHQEEMDVLKEKIKEAKTKDCRNMVEEFVAEGRVINDETIINKWVELAENDFEGIKTLIENQPIPAINKSSEKIEDTLENKGSYMVEKLANLKNKK